MYWFLGQCFTMKTNLVLIQGNLDRSDSLTRVLLIPWMLFSDLEDGASIPTQLTSLYTYTLYSVCPGQDLANDSFWIAAASILKMYSISLASDTKGNEIPAKANFTSGMISWVCIILWQFRSSQGLGDSHPEPFQCEIKPRSASAIKLLAEFPNE